MPALDSMIIVALAFLLAGSVKGVTGLGLPSVSLAVLTATLGLKAAMAILIVPSFVTNVWQALVGGHLLAILRRIWSLLLAVCVATWFGVGVLAKANADVLAGLLGVVLCGYAVLGLVRVDPPSPGRLEPWLSPAVGAVSGVLNGMTGSFVVPGRDLPPVAAVSRATASSSRWACCSPPPRLRWPSRCMTGGC